MRVLRTILGMLLLTIGLPALLGGAGFWAAMQHRDAGGAFRGALQDVTTSGYAVVVTDVDGLLKNDASFARYDGTRLRITSATTDGPAFIGIAPADAVARYFTDVPVQHVGSVDIGTGALPVATSRFAGTQAPADVPAASRFWWKAGSGALSWNPAELSGRSYSLVIMSPGARPGLRLTSAAEVSPGWLNSTTWALLILGTLFVMLGMIVLAWPGRRREVVYVVEPSQVPDLIRAIGAPSPLAATTGRPGGSGAGRHRPRTLAEAPTTWPPVSPAASTPPSPEEYAVATAIPAGVGARSTRPGEFTPAPGKPLSLMGPGPSALSALASAGRGSTPVAAPKRQPAAPADTPFEASAVGAWVAETSAARARETEARAAAVLAAEAAKAAKEAKEAKEAQEAQEAQEAHEAKPAVRRGAHAAPETTPIPSPAPNPTSPAAGTSAPAPTSSAAAPTSPASVPSSSALTAPSAPAGSPAAPASATPAASPAAPASVPATPAPLSAAPTADQRPRGAKTTADAPEATGPKPAWPPVAPSAATSAAPIGGWATGLTRADSLRAGLTMPETPARPASAEPSSSAPSSTGGTGFSPAAPDSGKPATPTAPLPGAKPATPAAPLPSAKPATPAAPLPSAKPATPAAAAKPTTPATFGTAGREAAPAKPAEIRPTATPIAKAADPAKAAKTGGASADEARPGNAKPGNAKPGNAKPGNAKPADAAAETAKAETPVTGIAKVGPAKIGLADTGTAKAEAVEPGSADAKAPKRARKTVSEALTEETASENLRSAGGTSGDLAQTAAKTAKLAKAKLDADKSAALAVLSTRPPKPATAASETTGTRVPPSAGTPEAKPAAPSTAQPAPAAASGAPRPADAPAATTPTEATRSAMTPAASSPATSSPATSSPAASSPAAASPAAAATAAPRPAVASPAAQPAPAATPAPASAVVAAAGTGATAAPAPARPVTPMRPTVPSPSRPSTPNRPSPSPTPTRPAATEEKDPATPSTTPATATGAEASKPVGVAGRRDYPASNKPASNKAAAQRPGPVRTDVPPETPEQRTEANPLEAAGRMANYAEEAAELLAGLAPGGGKRRKSATGLPVDDELDEMPFQVSRVPRKGLNKPVE